MWVRAVAVLASLVACSLPVAAETVTLRSHDGSITLTGDLKQFDGERFSLSTAIGDMVVDAMQVSCEGAACPPPELLRSRFGISGSTTIGEALMPALIEAYGLSLDAGIMREPKAGGPTKYVLNQGDGQVLAEIELAAAGSDSAFADMLSEKALFGVSSRRVKDKEISALRAAAIGDLEAEQNETILALDALTALVSPENPVTAISVEDLARVFSGEIANWSQLGGPDAPIALHVPAPGHGTRDTFESIVMRPAAVAVAAGATPYDSYADLSDAVASDPFAIGVTGVAYVRNARSLSIRSSCGLTLPPDAFSVKTEEYPLSRRLFLYKGDRALPSHARKFLEFATSDAAQDVIADAGFVDQSIARLPLDDQGRRLANTLLQADGDVPLNDVRAMLGELVNAERLSTTLRFEPGASLLDTRARADIRRIGDFLSGSEAAESEILLIGFTDSVGRGELNRALSLRRADQARTAILATLTPERAAAASIRTLGFGEMSPVGCNDSFDGRRANRRVEVWVRPRA